MGSRRKCGIEDYDDDDSSCKIEDKRLRCGRAEKKRRASSVDETTMIWMMR